MQHSQHRLIMTVIIKVFRILNNNKLTPNIVMQFCCADHTSRHLAIIETDSQHEIELKQITIKAFNCILHRNSKVE